MINMADEAPATTPIGSTPHNYLTLKTQTIPSRL